MLVRARFCFTVSDSDQFCHELLLLFFKFRHVGIQINNNNSNYNYIVGTEQ